MTEHSPQGHIELSIPADDLILPFQAEQADVSGRLVKLGPVVDTILSRHDYPEAVSQLLGEAVALTALLGAALFAAFARAVWVRSIAHYTSASS